MSEETAPTATVDPIEASMASELVAEDEPHSDTSEIGSEQSPEVPPSEEQPDGATPSKEETPEEPEAAAWDDELPARILKEYRPELVERYAKKFGIDPTQIADNKPLQSLINAKINSDIHVQQLESQRQETPEETPEEQTAAPQTVTPEVVQQVYEQAGNAVDNFITVHGANLYTDKTSQAWGAYNQAVASGDKGKIEQAAHDVTKTQLQFVLMAMADILPKVVPGMVQGQVEGIQTGQIETQELYGSALAELAKDPEFSDIEQFYQDGSLKALDDELHISDMLFYSPDGRPLEINDPENAQQQYLHALDILRGRNGGNPQALVQRGMEAGKRQSAEATQRQNLGKLGNGRPSGNFTPKVESSQDFMDALIASDRRNNPMSALSNEMTKKSNG